MSKIKKIIGSITKTLASSAEIQTALDAARTAADEADAAVAAAKAAYEAALLTETPAMLRTLVNQQVDEKIAADQARARAAKLEVDLEKTLAAEAEDGRAECYAQAKALADTARKKLWTDYPKAAEAIRDILRSVAEADIAVRDANEDLPTGAAKLESPEGARSTHSEWKEELGRDQVNLWAAIGSPSMPLRDDQQKLVENQGSKTPKGYLRGYLRQGSTSLECEMRPFVRIKSIPNRSGWSAESLASGIALPGLEGGDSDYWEPTRGDAVDVIRALEKLPRKRPPYSAREPEFTYSPVRE